jgi:hypothetical protein
VISCDNLPHNGAITRTVVLSAAAQIDATLPDWIDANVVIRSSMVDRITPRTRTEDIDELEHATGIRDEAAVVTEHFSEWIIEQGFAGPAPDWERVGVQLVEDLAPYEQRKLRILNGAHSLLAYRGLLAGHEFVADAFADSALREVVEEYWQAAANSCSLPSEELHRAIEETRRRFSNPRIRHALAQIALDGRGLTLGCDDFTGTGFNLLGRCVDDLVIGHRSAPHCAGVVRSRRISPQPTDLALYRRAHDSRGLGISHPREQIRQLLVGGVACQHPRSDRRSRGRDR